MGWYNKGMLSLLKLLKGISSKVTTADANPKLNVLLASWDLQTPTVLLAG